MSQRGIWTKRELWRNKELFGQSKQIYTTGLSNTENCIYKEMSRRKALGTEGTRQKSPPVLVLDAYDCRSYSYTVHTILSK